MIQPAPHVISKRAEMSGPPRLIDIFGRCVARAAAVDAGRRRRFKTANAQKSASLDPG
jgi:hypothetical protein